MTHPNPRVAAAALLALMSVAASAAELTPGLRQAEANYPKLIVGGNVHAAAGVMPLACPAPGSRVEVDGKTLTEYLGADPSNPDLCTMRQRGRVVTAWYGIWLNDWPGAADAHAGFQQVMQGRTGAVAAFDTHMLPGLQWHDLLRNEGVEDIQLLGKTYHALKLSHYREGMDGNGYRSVSTVWKDIGTGMLIYSTYQHISGAPELSHGFSPSAIVPAAANPS